MFGIKSGTTFDYENGYFDTIMYDAIVYDRIIYDTIMYDAIII